LGNFREKRFKLEKKLILNEKNNFNNELLFTKRPDNQPKNIPKIKVNLN
jgi:hypothetical protein